jgi:hypothetical protein
MTMPNAQAHWDADTLGGRGQWVADDAARGEGASEGLGIFTVWSIPKRPQFSSSLPFTAAAVAARSEWNMVDNPYTRCEQPGMPRIMLNPHPFEFINNGETITLLGEEFDMVRTIHMKSLASASRQPGSRLGYSVGQWVDGSLIVHTSNVSWPYFDGIGTPQSDAVEMVESFTLLDDGARLDYSLRISDPETFSEAAVVDRYWLALGEKVEPFDCQVY